MVDKRKLHNYLLGVRKMDLDLTDDEVLILWEFFHRYSSEEILGIQDQAEQRALWNMECVLEKIVGNCYSGRYEDALKAAMSRLRDDRGTNSTAEHEKGRIALWLEPEQIEIILNQWRNLPEDTPPEELERWGKLAFRCNAALHKAGGKS